jgi:hypothetical protein
MHQLSVNVNSLSKPVGVTIPTVFVQTRVKFGWHMLLATHNDSLGCIRDAKPEKGFVHVCVCLVLPFVDRGIR